MKFNVLENKKNRLVFEVDGVGHTYTNILKNELWNDDHVKVSTYAIKHPQVSKPKFILETDGDRIPKAALSGAVGRLKKLSEKFKKEMSAIR
ncbi:MAG: DNA-directed RNA polymerase subunit L [Flavobacteriales bacterium]|jgi:DNA-directed RNA polymerase subunit L|nr:DNA-directed RNA polymerase subunit L [Flavobacteriales bacterium]|tara:strand:+ start:112 stop:387 length:276 start_codon:yes stop_codon:yes gene_type:complete